MNQGKDFRNVLPGTEFRDRRSQKEIRRTTRKDWGFTDQYRRMMQRYPDRTTEETQD